MIFIAKFAKSDTSNTNQTFQTIKNSVLPLALATLFSIFSSPALMAYDNNVVIQTKNDVYTILENKGVMTGVKSSEQTTFLAQRADDIADVVAMYDENTSIDKASAPGATPYYRTAEDDQIFYDGSRICILRVPLKQGKKTKAVFERTFKAPEQFCGISFSSPYHTVSSTTVVKVPAKLAGRIYVRPYRFRRGMTLQADTLPDGAIDYTVTCTDLPPLEREPGAPAARVSEPQLFVGGYFADSGELYSHLSSFVSEPEDYGEAIASLAAALRAKAGDDISLIDSTAAWVRQNIRYLAIEHGEYGQRPAQAADVLARKAGDCKGSANLIKALLKSNGIDARLVWIGTEGSVPTGFDEFPAMSSGNHMIAAAMTGDSIIYIDGTTSCCPAGYIPPGLRRRSVLIEDGPRPILTHVPDVCRRDDTDSLRATYRIDGTALAGTICRSARGLIDMSLRQTLAGIAPKDHASFIERYLRYPKKSVAISNAEVVAPASSPAILIRADISENNSARQMGDRILLELKPVRSIHLETVNTKDRRRDYVHRLPCTSVYDYTVELPEGYVPEQLPDPFEIDDRWLRGHVRYSYADGILHCSAMFEPVETYVPVDCIDERNKSVRALMRASDTQIALIRK